MKKSFALLSIVSAFAVQAQISPLEYANPTPMNAMEAIEVWDSLKTNFRKNSECFNRAMTWSYDVKNQFGFEGKRIYIHYSYLYNKELSSGWGYHTAPIFNVEGEDIVFDKGFLPWIHSPLTKEMWEDKFLLVATDKLVTKRIKLIEKIEKEIKDIAELDKSGSTYYEKLDSANRKLRKYQEELVLLKVTDKDLDEQRPRKIARIERWIDFLNKEIPKNKNDRNVLNQLTRDLSYFQDQLKKVKSDKNYAALVSCDKITHIEELDYNKTDSWCFIQEASDFYWNVPQLRNLNYGLGYSLTKVPLQSQLPQSRIDGEKYVKTEYDMNEVWTARRQAFGNNYSKIWAKEYELKERAEEAVKEIYKVARNGNKSSNTIQNIVNQSRSSISRSAQLLQRYGEALNNIENDNNKYGQTLAAAQAKIQELARDASVSATQTKSEAYTQAQIAEKNLSDLEKRAKSLEKTIKDAIKR